MEIPAELREDPPGPALEWVASQVGAGARVTAVRRLRNAWAAAVHAIDVDTADGVRHELVLRRWARTDIPPDAGVVEIDGVDVTWMRPQQRNIGFVFQHYAAFKHLSVYRNVAFGLEIRKRPKDEVKARVRELLELVHLEQFADRLPAQLSGGQRQRMALARALAVEPKVLLLDEPFGALDAKVRRELRDWLRRLHDEVHVTTVFVTHDQEEALEVSDEIVVVNGGRVEQVGTPDQLYDEPVNPFVMEFLGPVTTLGGSLIRPHDIDVHLQPVDGAIEAAVTRLLRVGFEVRVDATAGEETIGVQLTRGQAQGLGLTEGQTIWLRPSKGGSAVAVSAATVPDPVAGTPVP